MKKSIKYIALLSIACIIGFSSCKNEDPDIFDDSSAQRLNEAVKKYNADLCSSTSGWAMEYFATDQEKGVTFLMRFDKNGAVDIASKNSWTKDKMLQESSLFEIIADNGPVLTFNTFNSLFHYFSSPEIDGNGDGTGLGGDYEFILMKSEPNLITLKGKKGSLDIFLRRLPEGQVWSEYYANLDKINKSLFSSKISTLNFNASGEKYTITNASNQIMHFVPEGGDAISQTIKVPFIVTETGIRFAKPFKGSNEKLSVESFTIAENGSLISTDDSKATISAPPPSELIADKTYAWRIRKESLGGRFVDAYNKVVTESKAKFNTVFTYFQFKYDPVTKQHSLSFKNGKYTGMLFLKMTSKDDASVSFTTEFLGDNNGGVHLEMAPSYKEFLTLLCSSEYTITTDSAIMPSLITFTSKSNPSETFIVDLQ